MLPRVTRRIQEKLGLTKSEAAVLLFLSFGLIVGGGVKLFKADLSSDRYDYSNSDSFFKEASSRIDSILAAEEDSSYGKEAVDRDASEPLSVDINNAGITELTAVPGIGKVTAQRIVEYRNANGKFRTPEELMRVKGIGSKKFEKIRKHVRAD